MFVLTFNTLKVKVSWSLSILTNPKEESCTLHCEWDCKVHGLLFCPPAIFFVCLHDKSHNCQFWHSLGELLSTSRGWTRDSVNSAVNWTAVTFTMWHTMCNEIRFIFVFWTLNFSQCWTFLNSSVSTLISFMYPWFYCLVMIPKWDWVMFFLSFLMFYTVPCFWG